MGRYLHHLDTQHCDRPAATRCFCCPAGPS